MISATNCCSHQLINCSAQPIIILKDKGLKMTYKPLFAGLIIDEFDNPVELTYVGSEPFYVVNDAGFRRHIPTDQVDRQVLEKMKEMVEGNEDLIADQTAKMLGKDDLFTHAVIQNQLKKLDQQFETLMQSGIPEEGRAYMGMMGFRVTIDIHGVVLKVEQPGSLPPDEDL